MAQDDGEELVYTGEPEEEQPVAWTGETWNLQPYNVPQYTEPTRYGMPANIWETMQAPVPPPAAQTRFGIPVSTWNTMQAPAQQPTTNFMAAFGNLAKNMFQAFLPPAMNSLSGSGSGSSSTYKPYNYTSGGGGGGGGSSYVKPKPQYWLDMLNWRI
jgi:hypothetical protein